MDAFHLYTEHQIYDYTIKGMSLIHTIFIKKIFFPLTTINTDQRRTFCFSIITMSEPKKRKREEKDLQLSRAVFVDAAEDDPDRVEMRKSQFLPWDDDNVVITKYTTPLVKGVWKERGIPWFWLRRCKLEYDDTEEETEDRDQEGCFTPLFPNPLNRLKVRSDLYYSICCNLDDERTGSVIRAIDRNMRNTPPSKRYKGEGATRAERREDWFLLSDPKPLHTLVCEALFSIFEDPDIPKNVGQCVHGGFRFGPDHKPYRRLTFSITKCSVHDADNIALDIFRKAMDFVIEKMRKYRVPSLLSILGTKMQYDPLFTMKAYRRLPELTRNAPAKAESLHAAVEKLQDRIDKPAIPHYRIQAPFLIITLSF